MRVGITGSNGFIGSELVKYFVSQGNEVVLYQRRKPETLQPNTSFVHFDLNDTSTVPDVSKLDVLIHTAFVLYEKGNESSKKNVEQTLALSEACTKHNVQFVFFSTLSAHETALSEYGKHKYELEQKLDKSKVLILKLGLVIGAEGLYSRIKNIVAKSIIIPMIGGGNQPEQIVLVSDVVKTIALCIEKKTTGIYCLASHRTYTLKEIFSRAAKLSGRTPLFIPVPYFIADMAIGLVEFLHLPFPVSKENLLGLKRMIRFETEDDLKKLGVELSEEF